MTDFSAQAVREGFLARGHRLLIGGAWVDALSGERIAVSDPATGDALGTVAQGGADDVARAVDAARAAFASGPWADMPAAGRAALLNRLADLIEANADEIALIESLDGGNPITSVRRLDLGMAITNLRSIAGWADKIWGDVPMVPAATPGMAYVVREPIGVVAAITPWNAPFLMAVHKIAPALAMGCTVILKPAELAPFSAIRLGELALEAGFPAGVLNIVTGFGHVAGQALVDHPGVDKISFTGSTRVGRSILAGSAAGMKRVTLELGGKSPIIVMADADIDRAAIAIADEIALKSGQYCAAGTRLFAHPAIHDTLVAAIARRLATKRLGAGLDAGCEVGPLISRAQLDRVTALVDEALADGAVAVLGGKAVARSGFFFEPTVLTGVTPEMRVYREEVFGPVLSVTLIDPDADLAAIAALANDTEYGLAAKIWTRDLAATHQLARMIRAGSITINGGIHTAGRLPFGGFKQSGLGREGAREGMLAFTELKSVSLAF